MKKITTLILVIITVAVTAYATYAVWQFRKDKLQYIYLVNSTFTSTLAKKIQSDIQNIKKDVGSILSVVQTSGLTSESAKVIQQIFKNTPMFISLNIFKLNNGNYSEVIAIYNKDYIGLHETSEEELKTLSLQQLHKFSNQPVLNEMITDIKEKEMHNHIYALNKNRDLFLTLNVSKEYLLEALAQSDMSETSIVNSDGIITIDQDKSKIGKSVAHLDLFKLAKSNPVREGTTEYTITNEGQSDTYIGNFYKLDKDMIFFSSVNKDQAFKGMQIIILNTILFAFLVGSFAIIVGIQFSRTITAPLQKLMGITEDIAAGRYKVEADINTNDEVGQLADYFVTLGQKLDERETQLANAMDLANKDGMTGVYNHRYFKQKINEYFNLTKRQKNRLSIILTDIDFFKKFNDTYGHQQGDQVIKEIAEILKSSTRDTDFVARYGGEEFVVILPDTDNDGAVQLAERIRQNYANNKIKNINGGEPLSSTCSLGVATYDGTNFETYDQMIEYADQCLYQAKEGGRNQVVSVLS